MSWLTRMVMHSRGRKLLVGFEAAVRDPESTLRALLESFLVANANTVFGRDHNFAKIDSAEAYRRAVPMRDYEALSPWIDRLIAGEKNMLTAIEPFMFGTTSGTTDRPKLTPVTKPWMAELGALMRLWLYHGLLDHLDLIDGKVVSFVSPAVEGHTDAGVPIGSVSGLTYRRAVLLEDCIARKGGLRPADAWPNLRMVGCWLGGSVGVQSRRLSKWYGDVPLRDLGFPATEATMSISITEGTAAGVLALKLNFYEFIPEDEFDAADPTVLLAHELEDGGRYYILLTTRNGLYRYDINDIIEVQGFHHRAPLVAFVRKGRDMCNITGEKLHVGQVAEAFFRAIDEVSFEATQAQLIPDVESSRYDMLLETDEREEARLEMFAEAFDRQLRAMNMEYAGKRHSDRLGLPRIWCMKAGWSGYRQRVDVEQHGKRDAQYKWPFLQLSWDQLARDHVALPPPGVDGSVPAPASAE